MSNNRTNTIHFFQWKLQDIKTEIPIVAKQRFTHILITPVQPNKFTYLGLGNTPWWGYYQPIDFSIGNQLGTKDDFIELCEEAHKYGINIVVDVVMNHCACGGNGVSIDPQVNPDLIPYLTKFEKVKNWEDRWEITHKSIGLPGYDLTNNNLQKIIRSFLEELIECGADGFRIDAAKHMLLPSEGSDFFPNVFGDLCGKDNKKLFNMAEVIFSPDYIISQYCEFFNVITNSICPNLRDKLIVYPFNHDTDNEFKYTSKMNDDMCINEYRIMNWYKNVFWYVRPFNDTWMRPEIREINSKRLDQ